MLTFTNISEYKPGDLSTIIHQSYSELIDKSPAYWQQEEVKWDSFDRNAFNIPEMGKCLFVSVLDVNVVGLASWDPRPWPEYGAIGQNCVLPEFRGQGIGTKQIQEVLRIFKVNGVKQARVTTCEHPFFISAQKMYQSLGFQEVSRTVGGPDPKYQQIHYEMNL